MKTAPHSFGAPDSSLRKDIRMVTTILGETLVRAEGQELLDLVEQVRAHSKGDRLEDLPEFDLETTIRLVRAFTAYFHLANVTEQVHRGRALLKRSEADGGGVLPSCPTLGALVTALARGPALSVVGCWGPAAR